MPVWNRATPGEHADRGTFYRDLYRLYQSHLPELGDYVSVNLIGSRYENHEIQLKATITYQLPFSILPVSKIKVGKRQRGTCLDGV